MTHLNPVKGTPDDPTGPRLGQLPHRPPSRPSRSGARGGEAAAEERDLAGSSRRWAGQLGHGQVRPDLIAHPRYPNREVRCWWLGLPFAPQDLPNLNHRQHWSVKARLNRQWREAVHVLCRAGHIPPLPRVLVCLYYTPAVARRRDPDNLVAALKPAVDGLVDAKVVPDDTAEYVTRDMPIILPPMRLGPDAARLALYLEELP